ncbi:hypothetical protein ACFQV8_00925 [Pseudonocardia benzenivorans]
MGRVPGEEPPDAAAAQRGVAPGAGRRARRGPRRQPGAVRPDPGWAGPAARRTGAAAARRPDRHRRRPGRELHDRERPADRRARRRRVRAGHAARAEPGQAPGPPGAGDVHPRAGRARGVRHRLARIVHRRRAQVPRARPGASARAAGSRHPGGAGVPQRDPPPRDRAVTVRGVRAAALRVAQSRPEGERIAIYASGGWSHFTAGYPWAAYRGPHTHGAIDTAFDREVLQLLEDGEGRKLAELNDADLLEHGEIELRAWIALVGALGDRPADFIVYEPFHRALMGMAVAAWTPQPAESRPS